MAGKKKADRDPSKPKRAKKASGPLVPRYRLIVEKTGGKLGKWLEKSNRWGTAEFSAALRDACESMSKVYAALANFSDDYAPPKRTVGAVSLGVGDPVEIKEKYLGGYRRLLTEGDLASLTVVNVDVEERRLLVSTARGIQAILPTFHVTRKVGV